MQTEIGPLENDNNLDNQVCDKSYTRRLLMMSNWLRKPTGGAILRRSIFFCFLVGLIAMALRTRERTLRVCCADKDALPPLAKHIRICPAPMALRVCFARLGGLA